MTIAGLFHMAVLKKAAVALKRKYLKQCLLGLSLMTSCGIVSTVAGRKRRVLPHHGSDVGWYMGSEANRSGPGQEIISSIKATGALRVWAVTWNMHGRKPPADLKGLLPPNQYHLYVVGTQECARTIAASVLRPSKKAWAKQIGAHLGDNYVAVISHSLQAIHLIVFVHRALLPLISDYQSDAVPCGLSNKMGNKGGVGISFTIGGTSMLFISSHLAPHQGATEMRNAHAERIEQRMNLSPSDLPSDEPLASRVSDRYDRVIWLGDLNYRINGTRSMIDTLLEADMHEVCTP